MQAESSQPDPSTPEERRLRESDALLSTIGEAAPDTLWVASAEGEILYVNRQWTQYTGLSAGAMTGKGFLLPVHPDDVGAFRAVAERAVAGGEEFEHEFRYRRHDGAYRWFWTRSVPLRDASGRVVRRVGMSRDVDDRRRAQDALRASRDALDTVFELAAVGLTLTDEAGRFVRVNRAFAEMCGFAPDELVGREAASLLPPQEREEAARRRADLVRGERQATRDFEVITRDGRRRTFRTNASTFIESDGRRLLIGVAHDVTEQREAETAMLEAGRRLHSVLDSIAEGYVVLDRDFRFVEINPAAQRIVFAGRPIEELIGRVLWDEYPQTSGGESYEQFRRAMRDRVPVHFEAHSAPSGRWFETHAYPREERREGGAGGGEAGRLEIYVRDITERKEAEAALRDALASVRDREAQVRLIADHVPALIGYVDRGLCYRFANSAYRDWIGLGPEQVVGKTIPELLPPEVFAHRLQYIERALRGEFVRFEGPSPHKDLGPRETEVCYAPDRDAGGAVRGFFVFVYDVTERKRSELALRDSEARLARAQRIARLGDWEIDWATRKVVWSAEMYRLFGVTPETCTPSMGDFFAKVPPEDHPALRSAVAASIKFRAPFDVDHSIVWPDGTIRSVNEQAEVLRDAAGNPVRVVGTMHDITDRKAAAAAVAASEREFRAIFELSTTGKALADPYTGRLLRVNRKFCEIVGYGEQELLARSTFDFTHPDDVARDRLRMDRLVAGEISEWHTDKRYIRKDGRVVWVTVSGSLIRDTAGNPLRLIATIQDVTARRQAEEAVRVAKEQAEAAREQAEASRAQAEAALEQAEAANKAKDHFLAILSHELRTPLTPVVMTLAGLEMDRSLSQGVRDDLAMIRRNVELETKLIDDLLDVTRIAHGKLRLHPVPVETGPLIEGVIDLFHSELRVKRLSLRRQWHAADARVSGDPARLQQVFWNLVRNAIKFTPEGGNVTVRTHNPDRRTLAIEVRDDGVGIEPAALPRLFNAFEQAEQSVARQFGGLGLGLAISKALVELHGGTVRAESAGRGRGATFTVELPTIGAVEEIIGRNRPGGGREARGDELGIGGGDTAAPGASGQAAPHAPQPHVRVLLVEDHPDTLRVLKRLLEKMGYAVVPASTAAGAMEALAAHSVDVIVSDIGLPDATGHDLIRKVRASEAHGGLPAIAISGFGMDADVRNSHAAGFITHMTKPVDVRQLDVAIRTAVRQKGKSAEAPR